MKGNMKRLIENLVNRLDSLETENQEQADQLITRLKEKNIEFQIIQ